MLRTSLLGSIVGFVLATLVTPEAAACQPPPADLLGFSDSFPAEGASGVARDAGLLVFGSVVVAGGYDYQDNFYAENFELRDSEGQPVAVAAVPWYPEAGAFELAWAPETPLAAGATYSLDATIHRDASSSQFTEEQLAMGASLAATFTTGSGLTAPLTAGALDLRVSEVEVEVRECRAVGDCGSSCVVVGTRTVPELAVTFPAVAGGTDVAGYSAYLAVSAGSPLPFTAIEVPEQSGSVTLVTLRSVALSAASPVEVVITLDGEPTEPFVPCVSAIVWDPSGKTVTPESRCADVTVTVPPLDGEGGAGGEGAGGSSGAAGAVGGGSGGEAGGGRGGATGGGGAGAAGSGGAAGDASEGGDANGGSVSGSAGGAGEAAAGAPEGGGAKSAASESGCGCRTAPMPAAPGVPLTAVAVALLAGAGALRRRRCAPDGARRRA